MATATRSVYSPPKRYTFKQLEELWILGGGKAAVAPVAAKIALAESGGDPNAINHNSNGTIDRGLWQINSVHGGLSTTNALANARAAVKIANEAKGFGPWTTYRTGAYEKTGVTASTPALKIEPGAEGIGLVDPKLGKEVSGAIPGPAAVVKKAATGWVGELLEGAGKIVLTGVLLLAGAVLAIYGIMVAVRPREQAFSIPIGR